MSKRKTVADWKAEIEALEQRKHLLEIALYDAYRADNPAIDGRVGKPIVVRLSKLEAKRQGGDDWATVTVYRPTGGNPYVVVVTYWESGALANYPGQLQSSVEVQSLDTWLHVSDPPYHIAVLMERVREALALPTSAAWLKERA